MGFKKLFRNGRMNSQQPTPEAALRRLAFSLRRQVWGSCRRDLNRQSERLLVLCC